MGVDAFRVGVEGLLLASTLLCACVCVTITLSALSELVVEPLVEPLVKDVLIALTQASASFLVSQENRTIFLLQASKNNRKCVHVCVRARVPVCACSDLHAARSDVS